MTTIRSSFPSQPHGRTSIIEKGASLLQVESSQMDASSSLFTCSSCKIDGAQPSSSHDITCVRMAR